MAAPGVLFGRPVVYDAPTRIGTPHGSFEEVIAPGALVGVLSDGKHDTTMVREHDPGRLLGRTGAGTLTMLNAVQGLNVRVQLPDTTLGEETAVLVQRGDLNGMSFAFGDIDDVWHRPTRAGGDPVRVITRIGILRDVSVVTWPAYRQTSVTVNRGDETAPSLAARRHAELERGRSQSIDALRRRHHLLAVGGSERRGEVYRTLPAIALWCRQHRNVVRYCHCAQCGDQ